MFRNSFISEHLVFGLDIPLYLIAVYIYQIRDVKMLCRSGFQNFPFLFNEIFASYALKILYVQEVVTHFILYIKLPYEWVTTSWTYSILRAEDLNI